MLQIVNMCVHSFLSVTCVHVSYIVKSTTIILLCPGGVQIAESIFHFLVEGSTESHDNDECVHTVREGALNGEKTPYKYTSIKSTKVTTLVYCWRLFEG